MVSEVYEGELEENWYSQKNGKYRIGEKNLDDILAPYFHSSEKIRITIEVLSEKEKDPEETIGISLGRIIQNDEAIDFLGLNPYCVNEGADKNKQYQIPIYKAKDFGLI
jgi:hypothetical protein